jgi:T-lymphocyte triggering factor
MEEKRKEAIERIERTKKQAIDKLVSDHEQKYKEIKEYYSEITGINMDLIQSLKTELNETKKSENEMQRGKMRQLEKNQQIEGPLKEAQAEVEELTKIEEKHNIIKEELGRKQDEIGYLSHDLKTEEWAYEVKLQ